MNLSITLIRLFLWGAVAYPVGHVLAEADVLERPSIASARASNAVMLAVTQAGERLVAVGERGIVLLSDDQGSHWRQVRTPVSVSLTNVHFPQPKLGWAVGHSGVVLNSLDSGETWRKQLDGKQAAQQVLAAAKASGDARKLAEAERLVADGPDKPFFDVYFADDRRGLIVGAYGLILETRDGGRHWAAIGDLLDNPKGKHLYGIHATGRELLIAGEQGALFVSRDGGGSFSEIKTPYAGTYFGVVADGAGHWFAYGLRGNAYCSADGGRTWRKSDTGAPNTLTAGLRLTDGSVVLSDEGGRLLRSRACGQDFRALAVATPFPFTGISQTGDGALVLSGARGIARQGLHAVEIKP